MSGTTKNAARMVACWIAAIALCLAMLAMGARPAELPRPDFGGAQVAVIGTSLVHRAIPARGGTGQLLPDHGPHMRIGLAASSRNELLGLLDQAGEDGVPTVLLEANSLLFALQGQDANLHCSNLSCTIRRFIALERQRYSAGLRHLLAMPSAEAQRMDMALSEPTASQWRKSSAPLRDQSLTFHDRSNSDIVAAVERAQTRGTKVILLLPPRSPAAEQTLPDGQVEEMYLRANALASELGLPIFAPRAGWSDADFVDRAHMSREGRERFLRELRAWWAEQA